MIDWFTRPVKHTHTKITDAYKRVNGIFVWLTHLQTHLQIGVEMRQTKPFYNVMVNAILLVRSLMDFRKDFGVLNEVVVPPYDTATISAATVIQ